MSLDSKFVVLYNIDFLVFTNICFFVFHSVINLKLPHMPEKNFYSIYTLYTFLRTSLQFCCSNLLYP